MQTRAEVTYELGRSALSDQESLVTGIRQRTATLVAAHALVASFLGSTTLRAQGTSPLTWIALVTLVTGLILAAVLLAPWPMRFALDTRAVYEILERDASADSADWLAVIGFAHHELQAANDGAVRQMSRLTAALAILLVWQTLAWTLAMVVG